MYGRLGAAYWGMERTSTSSGESDTTGFSPLGEIGIYYDFHSNVGLSASYQYIDSIGNSNTGKYDSHGLVFGLTYTFGGPSQVILADVDSNPIAEETLIKVDAAISPPLQTPTFSVNTIDGLFGFDSIELSHGLIEQLTEIASTLNTYPQTQAVVVGHTDSTGSAIYNQKLSEHRAQAVINKLIELKVKQAQLEWRGEGETQPVAENKTEEGRAKNRRVEITTTNFSEG
ncbi:outer membrane protein A precursor [Vibrio astriarenae]|nr:outer membrane protein A precursor [Vibrio sp. C7]